LGLASKSIEQPARGYELRIVQEVLLALLASGPSHGYELRTRLALSLGPLEGSLSDGQVYVTLGRLHRAGLVRARRVDQTDRLERKVYELTRSGRERVADWLRDVSWPAPAPAVFHLKLVAAAAAGLADPVALVKQQRDELLLALREAQQKALDEPAGSVAGLLLEAVVLRLQADLRWLEACTAHWSQRR